jgi:uncharacterized protein YllA (UPF0747 family)
MRLTARLGLIAAVVLAASAAARAQDTGIAICDGFLKSYETCIGTKAPESARAQMKSALEAVRANWKAVAATAEGKKQLEPTCKQTVETIKQQTTALGCQW